MEIEHGDKHGHNHRHHHHHHHLSSKAKDSKKRKQKHENSKAAAKATSSTTSNKRLCKTSTDMTRATTILTENELDSIAGIDAMLAALAVEQKRVARSCRTGECAICARGVHKNESAVCCVCGIVMCQDDLELYGHVDSQKRANCHTCCLVRKLKAWRNMIVLNMSVEDRVEHVLAIEQLVTRLKEARNAAHMAQYMRFMRVHAHRAEEIAGK